jgi:surfactin synthase thioesterase subunit
MSFLNFEALLCWGEDDTATPLSSANKINSLVDDSILIAYPGDHFFFMNHADDISKNIEKIFLKTLEHN